MHRLRGLVAVILLGLSFAPGAPCEDVVPEKAPLKVDKAKVEAISNAHLLLSTIAYAERNKNPEAYYLAAKLMLEEPGHALDRSGNSKATEMPTPALLLSKAKNYAEPGSPLQQMIDSAIQSSNEANRDRVGGPGRSMSTLSPGEVDVYRENFYLGTFSSVAAVGDGVADLDLYVYDSLGRLVARDDDYTSVCRAVWIAETPGAYTIRVKNRGVLTTVYAIATN